jgi:chitinase
LASPAQAQGGGSSLRFYGTGRDQVDRVKIPIEPARPVDVGGDFTIEFWMKANRGDNGSGACSMGGDNWINGNSMFDRDVFNQGDHGDYGSSLAGGKLAFGVNNGSDGNTICGTTDLADGVWHHVALTRNSQSGALRIFVDGQPDAEGSGPAGDISYRDGRATEYPNDPFLVLGAEKHDYDRAKFPSYSGWLDEIRISTALRYSDAFAPPAGESPPTFDIQPPSLSIGDASVFEGESGTAALSFPVSLSATSGQTVTVDYATQNGTTSPASAPDDYAAITTTELSFPPGTTVQTITVQVNGDITLEQNETLFVDLSGAASATIADAQGQGTITNDDGSVLAIDDVSLVEGNSGTSNLFFNVSISKLNAGWVTAEYLIVDQTASAASDYTAISTGTLSFAAATIAPLPVVVQVNSDTLFEADETLLVRLTGVTDGVATIGDAEGVGTITNDDAMPTIAIGNTSIAEGNSGSSSLVFTVGLSAASGLTTTVDYATDNGTASAPADYTAIPAAQLAFPPGATTQTITVEVQSETLYENNETVLVNLTNPSNATIVDAQGVGIIANDDTMPTIAIGDASVTEGNSGSSNLVFTVSLSAPSGLSVSVNYAIENGTAQAPADYTTLPATALDFPAGTISQVVVVPVVGDTLFEDSETLLANLSNAAGATIADSQGQGTITNDDTMPTIAIGDASVTEGNSGSSNLVFTVSLSAPSGLPMTVSYATANGTAGAPADYTAIASTVLTFPAGTTMRTIAVQIKGDALVEDDETLLVNLSSPSNATIADAQGHGTIVNDDDEDEGYTVYLPLLVR